MCSKLSYLKVLWFLEYISNYFSFFPGSVTFVLQIALVSILLVTGILLSISAAF